MDIASHGLWGGVAFGRKNKKSYWLAFFFGVFPDLFAFSFGFVQFIVQYTFTAGDLPILGPADGYAHIPQYVFSLYNISHSFVTFILVFGLVWLIWKRPVVEMLAWPLHIVVDIFTHSDAFFPTPFLWPISSFHVNGIPWGNPVIFFPNVILLALAYYWFFKKRGGFKKSL